MKHLLMQESVRLAERGAGGWLRHGAWALALIGVGLLGAACQKKVEKVAPPPPEVVTVTLAAQPLQLTSELPGRTAPFCISEIRPQVSGIILKRLFTEGADVKAGQELYQIDPAPFQAALDNAQAAMERTAAQLPALQAKAERMRQALADKSVSQQDVDDAVSALDQARADLR
jgi:membrane fusion protein (multidrug efflux system)